MKPNKHENADSALSTAARSVRVGDKVMILGGLPKIRGLIGTVSCRKRDERYVNVYVEGMGKYVCRVDDLLSQNKTDRITMNTLDQIIQKQVDYIMDSFDFKSASEALRCVEHCWINKLEDEDREFELRQNARERMADAIKRAKKDPGEVEFCSTGCLEATCIINTQEKWARVNLKCWVEQSLNDGENYV